MQANDLEGVMAELRRLKKENVGLLEERLLLKVAAEKMKRGLSTLERNTSS
jgi:hypothetical protein